MADKAIPDISLGGAEQNMSREELAAVAKAIAALSQEDRDLLGAVQESPCRLTTTEQFLEFEKNADCGCGPFSVISDCNAEHVSRRNYGEVMEKKERMRIKGITMILSCLLLFAGCGENGGSEENVSTETAGQKVSEENSGMGQADAGMEFVELPVQTEQKLTENDFKVMKSLVGIQAGERQGSGVIYDEEENRILIATAGHVLADDTGEARVTFPDGTQVAATGVETVDSCDLAFLWVDKAELSEEAWKVCLPVQTDREVFDALKEYDDVWMYGGESGLPVYAFVVDPWIYVEDFDQYMLLLQGLIAPGMSGGGAFTEDGVFVGILCGGDEEGKVAVVPYSMIETERP